VTTFRDAIETAVEAGVWSGRPDLCADAVLAMPELEAVRKALRSMSSTLMAHHQASHSYVLEQCYHLPHDLAVWVLGEDR
jgi:hypothetical protein